MNKSSLKIKSIIIVLFLRIVPIFLLCSFFASQKLYPILVILMWSIWTSIEIVIENSETNNNARKSVEDKYTRHAVLYSHLSSLWIPCFYTIFFNQYISLMALVIGTIIFIFGSSLRLFAISTLGKYFTGYIQVSSDQVVCRKGIYNIIRHPGYVGLFFINIGPSIMLNIHILIVFIAVITIISLILRVRVEEKMLINHFGSSYLMYLKEVPACFPEILK